MEKYISQEVRRGLLISYHTLLATLREVFEKFGVCFSPEEYDVMTIERLLDEYLDTPQMRCDAQSNSIFMFHDWVKKRAEKSEKILPIERITQ